MTGTEKNVQLNKSPLFAHIEKVVYLTHEETEKAMNEGFLRREIIFRGKRSDNGEWVEGGVEYNSTTRLVFIVSSFNTHTIINRVNPKTVSEFTGLTDKNGKKIFEGDILQVITGSGWTCPKGTKVYYEVVFTKFNPENASWSEYIGYMAKMKSGALRSLEGVIGRYGAVVVGNIHDNPELLKGGEQ